MDTDSLTDRLAAVERAVTDGETTAPISSPADANRLDELEASVEDVNERLSELEASVQALRGYVGGVNAIDEEVAGRADIALAKVERLESELAEETALTVEHLDYDAPTPDDSDGERAPLVERLRNAL